MVNAVQENEEIMKWFFSGTMSEEDRLAILDEKGTDLVRKYLESSNLFMVNHDFQGCRKNGNRENKT